MGAARSDGATMSEHAASRLPVAESRDLVLACLEEVLTEGERHSTVVIGPSTPLVGRESVLDSLGLVTLIVDIEDRLRSLHGISASLADDRAMSQTRSPFRTVQTLAEYVSRVVSDDG